MDRFWIKKTLRTLKPKTHKIEPYEKTDILDGKKFQRKIFKLEKR